MNVKATDLMIGDFVRIRKRAYAVVAILEPDSMGKRHVVLMDAIGRMKHHSEDVLEPIALDDERRAFLGRECDGDTRHMHLVHHLQHHQRLMRDTRLAKAEPPHDTYEELCYLQMTYDRPLPAEDRYDYERRI